MSHSRARELAQRSAPNSSRLLVPAYGVAIFLSAFLLFAVQPLIAKAILPWFGGTPNVWTTCMLVFQSLLFAGYAYAHLITARIRLRVQLMIHAVLLLTALCVLPILPSSDWKPSASEHPELQVVVILVACAGLPFFVLSTSGPLLQRWFSYAHPDRTPYGLYAISNTGSLLALVSYPFVVEPLLSIGRQAAIWAWLFGAFAGLCCICGIIALRKRISRFGQNNDSSDQSPNGVESTDRQPPRVTTMAIWFLLAWVPSVMLLATTNQICLDVASVPFLWILPLSVYLLSFILCFGRNRWYWRPGYSIAVAITSGGMIAAMIKGSSLSIHFQVMVFAAGLFAAAMFCHGELVRLKPHPQYLTLFYLVLSGAGAAGGLFVSVLAPLIFDSFVEMHLGILATCVLVLFVFYRDREWFFGGGRPLWAWGVLLFTVAIITAGLGFELFRKRVGLIQTTRNFYGVLRLVENPGGNPDERQLSLSHGRTIHGSQFMAAPKQPTSYYGMQSGVGLALRYHHADRSRCIGIVGLGTGTLAVYGRKGDSLRFYEINPDVDRIARQQFTFLDHCDASIDIVMGDARLSIERELKRNELPPFDILAIDAFSSDSIPTHLLTREACEIYMRRLKQDGILAFHITNLHFTFEPVVAALAQDLNLVTRFVRDRGSAPGTTASDWILFSRDPRTFESQAFYGLQPLNEKRMVRWTDVHCDLFSILKHYPFERAFTQFNSDHREIVNRGLKSLESNDLDSAEVSFRRAVEILPDDAPTWVDLGLTLMRKGKTAEAVKSFERAIKLKPNYSEAYNNLGMALISTDRARGIQCFEMSVRTNPRNVQAHFNLGIALAEDEQYANSIQQFERVLAIDPNINAARDQLAIVRKKKLDQEKPHVERE